MKVLFVCQANVGRSQMAEAFYNFHTHTGDARSAGVEDFRSKYPHGPTDAIVSTMLEKHIDVSNQRVDFLTEEMLNEAEKVVVLCSKRLCPSFVFTSDKVLFREIQDPYQLSDFAVRQIRDQVEAVVLELITFYKVNRSL